MRLGTRYIAFEVIHLLIIRPELGCQTFLHPAAELGPDDSINNSRRKGGDFSPSTRTIVKDFYNIMGTLSVVYDI